jgi:hypothetical protein
VRRAEALREFASVAAGLFEKGEEIGQAEESAHRLAHVDEFELAATGAAGDVQGREDAEAGAVHEGDFFQVEDDELFIGNQSADFVAELWGVLEGELAMTFDDDGVAAASCLEVEGHLGGESITEKRSKDE